MNQRSHLKASDSFSLVSLYPIVCFYFAVAKKVVPSIRVRFACGEPRLLKVSPTAQARTNRVIVSPSSVLTVC